VDSLLGTGNGLGEYALVLLVYLGLFLLMRYGLPPVQLSYRRTYLVVFLGWSLAVFPGNYLFYRIGIMSFLPWLNNFLHCFVWIGLCLGYLYVSAPRRPVWHQFAVFFVYSFLVKFAEHQILGTWEKDSFFGIPGNLAYLLGWSMLDGLYPFISRAGIKLLSSFIPGIAVPGSR